MSRALLDSIADAARAKGRESCEQNASCPVPPVVRRIQLHLNRGKKPPPVTIGGGNDSSFFLLASRLLPPLIQQETHIPAPQPLQHLANNSNTAGSAAQHTAKAPPHLCSKTLLAACAEFDCKQSSSASKESSGGPPLGRPFPAGAAANEGRWEPRASHRGATRFQTGECGGSWSGLKIETFPAANNAPLALQTK